MQVIDHAPHAWFLLRDDAGLLLDVNCGHSAVGFDRLVRLSPAQVQAHAAQGLAVVEAIARQIRDTAARTDPPGLAPLAVRARADAAIRAWLAQRPP